MSDARIRATKKARAWTFTAAVLAWFVTGLSLGLAWPYNIISMPLWAFVGTMMALLARIAHQRLPRLYELKRLDAVAEEIDRMRRAGKPQVCCVYCGELYEAIDMARLQGYHCASVAVCDKATGTWFIESFVGSDYDMTLHRFVGVDPCFEMDPICDTCIKSMRDRGRIVLDRGPDVVTL